MMICNRPFSARITVLFEPARPVRFSQESLSVLNKKRCPFCAGTGVRFKQDFALHRGYEIDQLNQFWVDSQAFILMGAVIYIIAIIFKKGIELQNENELTI